MNSINDLRLKTNDQKKIFDLFTPTQKIFFKNNLHASIYDDFLTIHDLKVLYNKIGDLDFIAFSHYPSKSSSWTLHFRYTYQGETKNGFLIHSHGKKIRVFKTLDALTRLVYEEFTPECFTVSFSG